MKNKIRILSVLLGIALLNLAMVNAYAILYLAVSSAPLIIAQVVSITPIVLAAFGMFLIFRDGIIPLVLSNTDKTESKE